jgi:hypothetical protein
MLVIADCGSGKQLQRLKSFAATLIGARAPHARRFQRFGLVPMPEPGPGAPLGLSGSDPMPLRAGGGRLGRGLESVSTTVPGGELRIMSSSSTLLPQAATPRSARPSVTIKFVFMAILRAVASRDCAQLNLTDLRPGIQRLSWLNRGTQPAILASGRQKAAPGAAALAAVHLQIVQRAGRSIGPGETIGGALRDIERGAALATQADPQVADALDFDVDVKMTIHQSRRGHLVRQAP